MKLVLRIKKIDELNQVIADDRLNMSLSELTGYLSNIGCVIQPVNFVPKSALIKAKKTNDNKYLRLIIMGAVFVAAVIVLIPLVGNISKRTENNGLKSNIKKIEGIKTVVNDYYLSKINSQTYQHSMHLHPMLMMTFISLLNSLKRICLRI